MASGIGEVSSSICEETTLKKRKKENEVEVEEEEEVEEEKKKEVVEETKEEEVEEKKEEEEEDTCVYDVYIPEPIVTEDMFSEKDPEEYRTYCKYSIKTEGFYVPFAPEGALGVVTPIDPSNSFWPSVGEGAELAVAHYNKKRAGPTGQLKLLSLRIVNIRLVGGMIFYITLEAENVTSGETNDYQTKVFMHFDKSMEVLMFRKDPETVFELIERDKAGLL